MARSLVVLFAELLPAAALWLLPSVVHANDELITLHCNRPATAVVQALQKAIPDKGWTILATLDHSASSAEYGVKIQARTTIIFARMDVWVSYLIEAPTVAVELPHRVLVWEDGEGVWVSRNTIKHYTRQTLRRHEIRILPVPLQLLDDQVAAMVDTVCGK
jgi:uncharacterized protein (DUF302 family)